MRKRTQKRSEGDLQKALYYYTLSQDKKIWAHNIYLFNWESDFIAIDSKGSIFEYEIKLNTGDFKADFKKRKHTIFMNTVGSKRAPYTPNYFYFVCPSGVIDPKQVPSYAGLIYVDNKSNCKIVKKPRRIHNEKRGYSTKVLSNIAKSLGHRWYSK
jgi:hypothetical protein